MSPAIVATLAVEVAVGAGGGVGVGQAPAYGLAQTASGSMHAVRVAPTLVSQLRTVHVVTRLSTK